MRHIWSKNTERFIMVKYNKQDLITFPINAYVEIVDWEGDVCDIGVVVGIRRELFEDTLLFKVQCVSNNGVFEFPPKQLRRISNV